MKQYLSISTKQEIQTYNVENLDPLSRWLLGSSNSMHAATVLSF